MMALMAALTIDRAALEGFSSGGILAIEAGIRGRRRVVTSRGGHRIDMETPESFNRLVVEFLQEAP